MITHLVTHSGAFHGDDVLSYTLLKGLYPDATLVRTRDEQRINDLANTAITFDIGHVYDPTQNRFDHHQPNPPKRPDGVPYSAFGLIWQTYGRDWLSTCAGIPDAHVETVHKRLDARLVHRVDCLDNGVLDSYDSVDTDLTTMVFRSNLPSMDLHGNAVKPTADEQDARFVETSNRIAPFLHDYAQATGREAVTKTLLQQAMDTREHKAVLTLPTGMPWSGPLFDTKGHEDILLVVFPTSGEEWGVQCAPTTPNGLEMRRGFPTAWRGLRGAAMEEAIGVPQAHFCHTAGFFCATTGKDAALALSQATLETWKREDTKALLNSRAKETLAQDPAPVTGRAGIRHSSKGPSR